MRDSNSCSRVRALQAARALAACIVCFALALVALWWTGAFLPTWSKCETLKIVDDLDDNGNSDTLVLENGRIAVFDSKGLRWESPSQWIVANVHIGDVTKDGSTEIVVLVWKHGSFGQAKPFWVESDSINLSQHVFIFNYHNGQMIPLWMSSALGFDVANSRLDASNKLHLESPDSTETIWEWQSWGLVLVDQLVGFSSPRAETAQVEAAAGNQPASNDCRQTVTLLAVGDVIAHESIYESARIPQSDTFDFSGLFNNMQRYISEYDLAVVNQETPFVNDHAQISSYPYFGTPCALGDALVAAGFDIVLAATNHMNDKGERGIADTIDFWRQQHPETTLLGIHDTQADAESIPIVEYGGIRLALFNYTFHLNGQALPQGREFEIDTLNRQEQLEGAVRTAQNEADFTICFIHIGEEYAKAPTDEQRILCNRLIDDGADVIICSHSHVVQPTETIFTENGGRGVVFWSLGNFIANQIEPGCVLGGAARLVISRTQAQAPESELSQEPARAILEEHELIPTVCHFEEGLTTAYLLDDYTEELASRHYLNKRLQEGSVTLAALKSQWASVSSLCS